VSENLAGKLRHDVDADVLYLDIYYMRGLPMYGVPYVRRGSVAGVCRETVWSDAPGYGRPPHGRPPMGHRLRAHRQRYV
ncbi:MAG: hypothetical protein K2J07_00320, partial [Muribaculaceae bacterium]|nr:hypothetical protein [Muribaculaceae bacterium]